jgi:hypothetical protein
MSVRSFIDERSACDSSPDPPASFVRMDYTSSRVMLARCLRLAKRPLASAPAATSTHTRKRPRPPKGPRRRHSSAQRVVEPREEGQERRGGRDQWERRHGRPVVVARRGEEAPDRVVGREGGRTPALDEDTRGKRDEPHTGGPGEPWPRTAHRPRLRVDPRLSSCRNRGESSLSSQSPPARQAVQCAATDRS